MVWSVAQNAVHFTQCDDCPPNCFLAQALLEIDRESMARFPAKKQNTNIQDHGES
jgi:hypothetical protein